MSEIEPCPFCGGSGAVMTSLYPKDFGRDNAYYLFVKCVVCKSTGAQVVIEPKPAQMINEAVQSAEGVKLAEEVIWRWNKRPIPKEEVVDLCIY